MEDRLRRRSMLIYVLVGLAGGFLLILNISPDFAFFLLNIFLGNISLILAVLPHEFAHAMVAWFVGMTVFRVVIGVGKPRFERRLLGVALQINTIPYGGATLTAPVNPRAFQIRYILVLLAGPAANLVLAAVSWPFIERTDSFMQLGGILQPFKMFFLANAACGVLSLIPSRIKTSHGEISNDGLATWETVTRPDEKRRKVTSAYYAMKGMELMRAKRLAEAKELFESALKLEPGNELLLSWAGVNLVHLREYQAAKTIFLEILNKAEIKPTLRAMMFNNVAYADALLGDPKLLEEADRFSQEALKNLGWNPSIKGTRGTVLVEMGRLEEGIALLKEAMEQHTEREYKALNASHLAIAEEKRANFNKAEEYWALARKLDPSCSLLPPVKSSTLETPATINRAAGH